MSVSRMMVIVEDKEQGPVLYRLLHQVGHFGCPTAFCKVLESS